MSHKQSLKMITESDATSDAEVENLIKYEGDFCSKINVDCKLRSELK
jgi:hypothetical protein